MSPDEHDHDEDAFCALDGEEAATVLEDADADAERLFLEACGRAAEAGL